MDELGGASFATAVTITSLVLSSVIIFPMGSSAPNNAVANDSLNTIEYGSCNALSIVPFTSGKLNMVKNELSTT